eukprot:1160418-Rhodomonas_salina.3
MRFLVFDFGCARVWYQEEHRAQSLKTGDANWICSVSTVCRVAAYATSVLRVAQQHTFGSETKWVPLPKIDRMLCDISRQDTLSIASFRNLACCQRMLEHSLWSILCAFHDAQRASMTCASLSLRCIRRRCAMECGVLTSNWFQQNSAHARTTAAAAAAAATTTRSSSSSSSSSSSPSSSSSSPSSSSSSNQQRHDHRRHANGPCRRYVS